MDEIADSLLDPGPRQAVLCAVQLPDTCDAELAESLAELRRLARTLGLEVTATLTQRRASFDPAAYLGSGKLDELARLVESGTADTILVDHEITPSQARNLEKHAGATVLDRTAVILEIFHRHARSRPARAQVEIVRLKYMAPRLREQGKGKGRQQGGIGGKGAGESHLELDRRKIRDRIAQLTDELAELEEERRTQRARRADLARVALVGYTNAGKSTLMRGLTGSEVYVADKLFATLDTTVRALVPETHPRILVSDTVGFIKKLPHDLVASFKSTLDEALEASLLVHVVDASDPGHERQLEVTHAVLTEIGAGEVPRLLVFNKIDRVDVLTRRALAATYPDAIQMSAHAPTDVTELRKQVVELFERGAQEAEIFVPHAAQRLVGRVHEDCTVLSETWDDRGATFRVRAAPQTLESLLRSLADASPRMGG